MVQSDGKEEQVCQNVIIMRHGPRLDNFDEHWTAHADRPWDPPLYYPGKNLAFDTGKKIREQLGAPIHRVFVSPFLRCLQTASETIRALSSDDSDDFSSDTDAAGPPKIKVSIEFGLSEMLNTKGIRAIVAPKDGDFKFDISQCETHLPPGAIDHTAEHVYKKLPEWQETQLDAWARYMKVVRALADKYPCENLLLVTHGEGVASVSSAFMGAYVKCVDYCGYSHLRRPIHSGENQSLAAEDFTVKSQFGFTLQESSAMPVVV